MSRMTEQITLFWRKHPALLYGVAFMLGCAFALTATPWLFFPALALWGIAPFANRELLIRLTLALLLSITAYTHVKFYYTFPDYPLTGTVGEGIFTIDSLTQKKTHFGAFWAYKGTLKSFGPFRNLPVTLSIPIRPDYKRPLANRDYLVKGVLKQSSQCTFHLKCDYNTPWGEIEGTHSFAESRHAAKKALAGFIKSKIDNQRSATLLAGLATGDFDDNHMQFQFSRFGLQHIMAISGFHFSILAAFFSFSLQLFFERKWSSALLIALLSTYFLFLGAAPSILRSWIAIAILLTGYLIEKQGNGLNSLGIGLLAILIFNPLFCLSLGFQFSFAATAAIFLIYPLFDRLLSYFLKKRALNTALQMPLLDQHAFVLMSWIRQGIALTLAVNLIALPMMLYYFHKFPLLSLFYNLFFPFLISIAMLLLLLGFLCPWVHPINSWFTARVLDLTYNMPTAYDFTLFVADLSGEWVIVHLTIIFGISILALDFNPVGTPQCLIQRRA